MKFLYLTPFVVYEVTDCLCTFDSRLGMKNQLSPLAYAHASCYKIGMILCTKVKYMKAFYLQIA